MSGQLPPHLAQTSFRISVSSQLPARVRGILNQLPSIGLSRSIDLKIRDLYFVEGPLNEADLHRLASLICDPITERYEIKALDDRVFDFNEATVVEIALRPGVTDNVATQLQRAARRLGIDELRAAATGQRYEFHGEVTEKDLNHIARSLLVNDTIQRYTIGRISPEFTQSDSSNDSSQVESIPLAGLDEAGLLRINHERRLALDLNEMLAIQRYFQKQDRSPTDAELETLAQTWSEHCIHKTFKALITHETGEIDGLLRTTIQAATQAIQAPWVRSAFEDNAGIIAFDEQYDLSFKVETHNHPSAIEPFGGANTGVGGVVRDVLGVSHRPIAVTDVLCFGPAELDQSSLPEGVLHPRRIRDGVVAGVGDYGNKLGLATVNGAVLYHPGYTSNPLVYCGSIGIGPVNRYPRQPRPGDRVIVIGGRTGRDGLRGATFSSLTMDAQTGQVAGASVQIGDPITEKGVIEVVVQARDAGLYNAITDCGAGGLSSAIGEMSSSLGARVHLERAPLKYAGLAPWEIWLSEAQERMVLAVAPEKLSDLQKLCETYEVEMSDLGEFTGTARLEVLYRGQWVVELDEEFLHKGMPRLHLAASLNPSRQKAQTHTKLAVAGKSTLTSRDLLLNLLAHPNISSKEDIIRRYDHEVRGASVVRPFSGPDQIGPSDAAVMKPLETAGWQGFVLANGINPFIGERDPYQMAYGIVDEAIRNVVAVGGDPQRLALLDNFCWGNPRNPETLGSLVRAAEGCRDAAIHYRTPFISGKDSLNNEYLGSDGKRHAIPGTLLISSIAIHPDIRRSVTMDLKKPGSRLYLVGAFNPGLAGSHAELVAGQDFFEEDHLLEQVPGLPERAPEVYQALHEAIHQGLVLAAHDLSEGGLGVAAAEMALAGRWGLQIDLAVMDQRPSIALFGETNGCLLVEVDPTHANALETRFKPLEAEGNSFLKLLGIVTIEPEIAFKIGNRLEAVLSLKEARNAFVPVSLNLSQA
jgi:phosphoribosylformylglycinamidine synthase subunit PurSL